MLLVCQTHPPTLSKFYMILYHIIFKHKPCCKDIPILLACHDLWCMMGRERGKGSEGNFESLIIFEHVVLIC